MAKGPLGGKNKSPQGRKTVGNQMDKLREKQRNRMLAVIAFIFTVVFATIFGLMASEAMAQNPDVPNSAIALDIRAGTTGTVIEDSHREYRLLFAVIMPITERFTVTAKVERRRLDLRQRQVDGLWKFEGQSTFWEIGCKVYIGKRED